LLNEDVLGAFSCGENLVRWQRSIGFGSMFRQDDVCLMNVMSRHPISNELLERVVDLCCP
jgi:hypothetical protein